MESESLINTTTEDIKAWVNDVSEKLSSDATFMHGLETSVDAQRKIEARWLGDADAMTSQLCPIGIGAYEATANLSKLRKEAKERFYSSSAMEAVACVANSITGVGGTTSLEARERFRTYIQHARTIGSPSVYGVAFQADADNDFSKAKNLFVLKAPKIAADYPDRDVASEGIHEAIVGIFGTNSLRMRIPNFAYVYGAMQWCEPPIVPPKGDPTLCGAAGNTTYLIVENITPAITMSVFCEKASAGEFLAVYMQILYALKFAKESIGFTHYDLHTDNVLLREAVAAPTTAPAYIPYEDGTVYVRAHKIATIIDFGRSHILATNSDKRRLSFGCVSPSLVPLGIFRDRVFPIADAYKLLLHSLYFMTTSGNSATFDKVSKLVKYFNQTETVEVIIASQTDLYFSLPPTPRARGYNLEDFISFSRNEARLGKWPDANGAVVAHSELPKKSKIYGCAKGLLECAEPKDSIAAEIRSETSPAKIAHLSMSQPISLFGFFDVHAYLARARENGNAVTRDTLREYSSSFIRGFTRGESFFQQAVKKAVSSAQMQYNNFLRKYLEPDDGERAERAVFKYHPAPARLEDLLDVPESAKMCIDTIVKSTIMFSALRTIIELLRAFKYAISVYWPEDKGESPSSEITAAYGAILDLAARPIVPLREIFGLLAVDAKATSPEKFNAKVTPDLTRLRGRLSDLEAPGVKEASFVLVSFVTAWNIANETMEL